MQKAVIIVVQIVLGWIVGFVTVSAIGLGNGAELVGFPAVFSLVVWAVGLLGARVTSDEVSQPMMRLIGTFVVSAVGAAILLIPGAWGFQGLLMPLVGAVAGYHLSGMMG